MFVFVKIYFLHNGLQSFVRKDLDILNSTHQVREQNNYRRMVRNFAKNLRGVFWCDLVFCWFASLHFLPSLFLAKLLRKKIVIVAGGYDVADVQSIQYGNMRGGLKTLLVRRMLAWADRVISISASNQNETRVNGRVPGEKNTMIYHGFASIPDESAAKEPVVVTIGAVTQANLERKGIADFMAAAEHVPEATFMVVGEIENEMRDVLEPQSPQNLSFLGFLDQAELTALLYKAKVYVQASRHEGFACAVAEAMLHRCVPVLRRCFALPEVGGPHAFFYDGSGIDELSAQIRKALHSDLEAGVLNRNHILEQFPLKTRRAALLALLQEFENERGDQP